MNRLFVIVCLLSVSTQSYAEVAEVKYRGAVDLKPFICSDVTRSSFIERVCYDAANQYMLLKLKSTYYHYCEVPSSILESLISAPSMGRYYNASIKGSGSDGPFDCRTHRVPKY